MTFLPGSRITQGAALLALLALSPAFLIGQSPLTLEDCLAVEAEKPGLRPTDACRTYNLNPGFSFGAFIEQDYWQRVGQGTDRNYTMGLGLFHSGPYLATWRDQRLLWRAERAIDWISDHLVRPLTLKAVPKAPLWNLELESTAYGRAYSQMLSGTAFSPENLSDSAAVVGDRPYAFLLGLTTARVTVIDDDHAYTSEITLGTIGSRMGRNVQRFIHKIARGDGETEPVDPKGWKNQIHDFPAVLIGIPTARYGFTRSDRLAVKPFWRAASSGPFLFDLAGDVAGEVGYYTGTSVALRARFGGFSSPFWAWRSDPLAPGNQVHAHQARGCLRIVRPCLEGFLYGTIRGRATAYNALLQGYPGYDDYHISREDMNHFTHQVTTGISVTAWWSEEQRHGIQATYEAFGRRSPEFKGDFARPHTWGGLFVAYVRQ